MSEGVVVTMSRYTASAVRPEQYPAEPLPEIAFIGRSNVGKSSLINSLVRVRTLARTSKTPGKTQTINFFETGIKTGERRLRFYLVDLPGYGYAKVARSEREIWKKFIRDYLEKSRRIVFVAHLIDIRHEPMEKDIEMFRWLVKSGLPVLVIATKADKVSRASVQKNVAVIKRSLGVPALDVLPYSSVKGDGRRELLDAIASSLIE